MPPTRVNPLSAGNFRVEIDGIPAAGFSEVYGIDAEVDVIDFREGSDKTSALRKLPGESKFNNLILKRGLTSDRTLWDWMQQTLEGTVSRRNVSIVMMDEAGDEVLRFNARDAWPAKWSGPVLNAETSEVAIETLEIAHEGLTIA